MPCFLYKTWDITYSHLPWSSHSTATTLFKYLCHLNFKRLSTEKRFAFDTETTSLDYRVAQIVGFSVAFDAQDAYYVPLAHDYENAPAQLDREQILAQIKPILYWSDDKKNKLFKIFLNGVQAIGKVKLLWNQAGLDHDEIHYEWISEADTYNRTMILQCPSSYFHDTKTHFLYYYIIINKEKQRQHWILEHTLQIITISL